MLRVARPTAHLEAQLTTRLNAVRAASLGAVLQPRGFTTRHAIYRRSVDELIWVIGMQRREAPWQARRLFSLHRGVFVPGRLALLGYAEPALPRVADCCLLANAVALRGGEATWELRADDAGRERDEQVAAEIRAWLAARALPFLGRFTRLADLIAYLDAPRPDDEPRVYPRPRFPTEVQRQLLPLLALVGQPAPTNRAIETVP